MSSFTPTIPSHVLTTPTFRNRNVLLQKYTTEGKSARQVAVELNCSHDAVNRALHYFGIIEKRSPGKLSYGWKLENGRKIVDHDQQNIIQLVKALRKKGHSNQHIANELSSRKIPSPSGNKKWSRCTIRSILLKPRPSNK